MSHPESTLSRLALDAAAHGLWTLAPARALTLRPRRDGVLHLARGAAWATRTGPHAGTAEGGPQGDLLLAPGTRLPLRAGDALVLESIAAGDEPARVVAFDWRESAARHTAPAWHEAVARPAHDLTRALGEAAHAFARLARGALHWAGGRLARRQDCRSLHIQ